MLQLEHNRADHQG